MTFHNHTIEHRENALKSLTKQFLNTTLRTPIISNPRKMSREELRQFLVARDEETNVTKDTIRKDIYFDFPNPYNLIFTVYYTMAKGTSVHKDFKDPTKAFQFWIRTPMRRNSSPFISVQPPHSDSFPYNFRADGYPFQIALRYIEYLDRTEEWVKFLEEAHPNDLK